MWSGGRRVIGYREKPQSKMRIVPALKLMGERTEPPNTLIINVTQLIATEQSRECTKSPGSLRTTRGHQSSASQTHSGSDTQEVVMFCEELFVKLTH